MSILLDIREHALIQRMQNAQNSQNIQNIQNIQTQQLVVGDIWIQADAPGGLIIERKTTADFEASILDGRYREQRTRLLAYCAEHKLRPLYILEQGLEGNRRTLEKQSLQKMLHRLMLRYNIAVYCTSSIDDTVQTLYTLQSQLKDDPKVFLAETLSYTDVMHTSKKANTAEPKVFAIGCLQQCPGISVKIASAIIQAFGTLQKVMEQDEATLALVKSGERKIGTVLAKRLWNLLHYVND